MRGNAQCSVAVVVPAYNEQATIAATVRGAASCGAEMIVVVDDGSDDETAVRAGQAGAVVVRLERRCGKGRALMAGLETIDADIVLLLDGDVGDSARFAVQLVRAVDLGRADLAIGVLPPGQSGGFGIVQAVARLCTKWLGGCDLQAPLSGQRAMRRALIGNVLPLGDGFGVEVAMNIRAARAGAAIVEIPVLIQHRSSGRSLRGVMHRSEQLIDLVIAVMREWRRGSHR